MKALHIHESDNVAVALGEIPAGAEVRVLGGAGRCVAARQAVPFAHKIALGPIARGAAILKYGVPIAFAAADIAEGEWVHGHNAKSYFVARREGEIP
jgi:altronate hydrolase